MMLQGAEDESWLEVVTCLGELTGVSPVDMALVGKFESASNATLLCWNMCAYHATSLRLRMPWRSLTPSIRQKPWSMMYRG